MVGEVFDRVNHTSDVLEFDSISPFGRPLSLSGLDTKLKILKGYRGDSSYVAGSSAFAAFCRTLLSDCILPYHEIQNLFHKMRTNDTYEPSVRRAKASALFAFMLW